MLEKIFFRRYGFVMPRLDYTPQNRESLTKTAKAMREQAMLLEVVAASMEEESFELLQVTNYDQLRRGLEFLDNFCGAAKAALRRARLERGDHYAQPPEKPKKEKK